ncbi:hypothetical protein GN157_11445 [Flavobacterium rakeshii]|uniref:Phospholipase D-like domain-containing protein n=1 Tax=Flavobacterium rakeshii TaxID=1038845 RepID=A0A6N8HF36_9FLAO|nr:phospholipase D family protein [Flavobacterium rakeshii]MUV04323.1 hypothetical protein [Flavobacterium rakeshii]
MADFLTTNGTSYNIENIIIEARKNLTLVSPYLQISKILFDRLKDANARGVNIKIIYGKDELNPHQRSGLEELKKLELYYSDNLHAKCYFNEHHMVITSMNMYEFSEKNNREMGVLVDANEDKKIYDKAAQEAQSIMQSAQRIYLSNNNWERNSHNNYQKNNKKTSKGFCIRCEDKIPYNPDSPYCYDCYFIWSSFENPHYVENVCHKCGNYENTTMVKPQCYNCFSNQKM